MSILNAAFAFVCDSKPVSYEEFGHGHINNTYTIKTNTNQKYVLQHINKYVFKKPEEVMANIGAVTHYLLEQNQGTYTTQRYLHTRDGKYFHKDCRGEYWRMYEYIPGICLDAPQCDEDLYQSALAFGKFQELLRDFPAYTLYETIPHFHDTVDRYAQFKASVENNAVGRAEGVAPEIAQLIKWEALAGTLERMKASGELPLRVTHNDTKLNNILFDYDTRMPLCVVDLDTIMPGSSLYDYGDSIRFGASTAAEDETDLSKVSCDMELFRVYTEGFLDGCNGRLTELELELLPLGAKMMTLECGIRFLADYLNGDTYFRTQYADHNLRRARTHFKLVADMENKWETMHSIVKECLK